MNSTSHYNLAILSWTQINAAGLENRDAIKLFDRAISAICMKAGETVSSFFLDDLLDRVIFVNCEKYQFLKTVKTKPGGLDLEGLNKNKSLVASDISDSMCSVLIDFFELFTLLTGGLISEILLDTLQGISTKKVKTTSKGRIK